MTKIQYAVTVHVLGESSTLVFSDAVNGGAGSAAYAAITAKKDIMGLVGSTPVLTFVPFSSIAYAEIAITSAEAEAPVDANCNETNE